MGKKYIIELEDYAFRSAGTDEALWRVKGFNSLVFDQKGLSKLKSYDAAIKEVKRECYDAGYARGLIQGKADARAELGIIDENAEVNQLELGDEIIWRNGDKSIVIDVDDDSFVEIDVNGSVSKHVKDGNGYRKTGKHYGEVGKLLGALKK